MRRLSLFSNTKCSIVRITASLESELSTLGQCFQVESNRELAIERPLTGYQEDCPACLHLYLSLAAD